MRYEVLPWKSAAVRGLAAFMLVETAFVPTAAHVGADTRCRDVNGHYAEHSVTPGSCPSPVGLCIEGDFSGAIRGGFTSTATSFTPTADTPLTAVVPFTGDGIIHARIDGRRGDLFFKSAGAFHTVDRGEIVDLQSISGGTGAFAGASVGCAPAAPSIRSQEAASPNIQGRSASPERGFDRPLHARLNASL